MTGPHYIANPSRGRTQPRSHARMPARVSSSSPGTGAGSRWAERPCPTTRQAHVTRPRAEPGGGGQMGRSPTARSSVAASRGSSSWYAPPLSGCHKTGSAQFQRSARSERLRTLLVAVAGSAALMRTKRGAHLVPRSRCAARNPANSSALSVSRPGRSCTAAITWSPTTGSGTA